MRLVEQRKEVKKEGLHGETGGSMVVLFSRFFQVEGKLADGWFR